MHFKPNQNLVLCLAVLFLLALSYAALFVVLPQYYPLPIDIADMPFWHYVVLVCGARSGIVLLCKYPIFKNEP